MERVTLSDALKSGDLEPFIRQVEADGLAGNEAAMDALLRSAITAPLPEDQTSRSPARGSSRGK